MKFLKGYCGKALSYLTAALPGALKTKQTLPF